VFVAIDITKIDLKVGSLGSPESLDLVQDLLDLWISHEITIPLRPSPILKPCGGTAPYPTQTHGQGKQRHKTREVVVFDFESVSQCIFDYISSLYFYPL